MKLPIFLSSALVVLGIVFGGWLIFQELSLNEKLTLIIYIATAIGGLVSAIFVIYGYFVNLRVFKESQKPKLLIQVHNGSYNIDVNNVHNLEHRTIIRYANLSNNECRALTITVALESEDEKIMIPRLLSKTMNLSPGDDRCRDFPTFRYLAENGIAQAVLDNLYRYKLKVSYSYSLMGEVTSSDYYYSWDAQSHSWQIV